LKVDQRNIEIKMPNQMNVKLKVSNDEKISDIINRACEEAKIKSKEISLRYKYDEIDNDKFIGELDL
jgi:hypothetical protein